MDFPDPVIKIAIEPKSKGDLEKMVRGARGGRLGGGGVGRVWKGGRLAVDRRAAAAGRAQGPRDDSRPARRRRDSLATRPR
jgi:hypothetical protein